MDPYQGGQVEMFMNVTGASEAVAFQNLQAHGGDLNAAINSFYNEGENFVPHMQSADGNRADWMEDDEPLPRQPILPSIPPSFPLPSIPSWATRLRAAGVEDTNAPRPSTRNTTSVVYQPRDVRAVPIDWRDEEEPRVRPHAGSGPLIEEIPATEASQLPSQSHGRIIIDDEDVPSTASSVLRTGGEVGGRSLYGNNNFTQDFPPGNSSLNPPLIDELPANDIEEEMLRAAIEASRKEAEAATRRMMPDYTEDLSVVEGDEARMNTEEDDLARAVSMSLKTLTKLRLSRNAFTLEEQKGFEDLIRKDGFYRVQVAANVLNPGQESVLSSVKARCLAAANLQERFDFYMDRGNVIALSYGASDCGYPFNLKYPIKWEFNSQTVLRSGEQAARALAINDSASGEVGEDAVTKKEPEKSFWGKYWMFIVPLGLILLNVITQVANIPEEQPSNQGSAQGASQQRTVTAGPRRR